MRFQWRLSCWQSPMAHKKTRSPGHLFSAESLKLSGAGCNIRTWGTRLVRGLAEDPHWLAICRRAGMTPERCFHALMLHSPFAGAKTGSALPSCAGTGRQAGAVSSAPWETAGASLGQGDEQAFAPWRRQPVCLLQRRFGWRPQFNELL